MEAPSSSSSSHQATISNKEQSNVGSIYKFIEECIFHPQVNIEVFNENLIQVAVDLKTLLEDSSQKKLIIEHFTKLDVRSTTNENQPSNEGESVSQATYALYLKLDDNIKRIKKKTLFLEILKNEITHSEEAYEQNSYLNLYKEILKGLTTILKNLEEIREFHLHIDGSFLAHDTTNDANQTIFSCTNMLTYHVPMMLPMLSATLFASQEECPLQSQEIKDLYSIISLGLQALKSGVQIAKELVSSTHLLTMESMLSNLNTQNGLMNNEIRKNASSEIKKAILGEQLDAIKELKETKRLLESTKEIVDNPTIHLKVSLDAYKRMIALDPADKTVGFKDLKNILVRLNSSSTLEHSTLITYLESIHRYINDTTSQNKIPVIELRTMLILSKMIQAARYDIQWADKNSKEIWNSICYKMFELLQNVTYQLKESNGLSEDIENHLIRHFASVSKKNEFLKDIDNYCRLLSNPKNTTSDGLQPVDEIVDSIQKLTLKGKTKSKGKTKRDKTKKEDSSEISEDNNPALLDSVCNSGILKEEDKKGAMP